MVCLNVTNEDHDVAEAIQVPHGLAGLPSGDYRLVGWDMDATGKRLVDEICQVAGYTTGSAYSQYVMPFKNLSPPAKKRHCIKVVTRGRYRVLKNSITNKGVPTKSEISALVDFLGWLEKVKGDASDGVILVHHEPRKVNPPMLIEALTKYNLLDRFRETVKGFANGFEIAKAKCANSLKGFSLRILSRVCLDQEEELNSAADRARLALQIVHHLSLGEENKKPNEDGGSGDSDATAKATVEFIREFTLPIEFVEKEYAALKVVLMIQNTLKPIFNPLLSMARRERQHASRLRRLLAEPGINYKQLEEAWNVDKRESLKKLVEEKVTAEEKDIEDLIEVLDCHFDPEKKPPVPTYEEKKKSKKIKSEKMKKEKENDKIDATRDKKNVEIDDTTEKQNGKIDVEIESPDTTTCDSTVEDKEIIYTKIETIEEVQNKAA